MAPEATLVQGGGMSAHDAAHVRPLPGPLPERCPRRSRPRRRCGPPGPGPQEGPVVTSTRALVRGIRPRQWSKNILVLAAPVAAGIAFQPRAVVEMGVAVVAFILASSGVYL